MDIDKPRYDNVYNYLHYMWYYK